MSGKFIRARQRGKCRTRARVCVWIEGEAKMRPPPQDGTIRNKLGDYCAELNFGGDNAHILNELNGDDADSSEMSPRGARRQRQPEPSSRDQRSTDKISGRSPGRNCGERGECVCESGGEGGGKKGPPPRNSKNSS